MKQISLIDFFLFHLSIECVIVLAYSRIIINQEQQLNKIAQLSYFL